MRQLSFLLLILCAIWPQTLAAQQKPVIGFLNSALPGTQQPQYDAFLEGLKSRVNLKDVTIEYKWAANDYNLLQRLADDFAKRRVTVIVAAGGPVTAKAAKKATDDIPIVFTTISDPIQHGFVASLNKPGGNMTGNAGLTSELDAKRLETLRAIKPSIRRIGVLFNPGRPDIERLNRELKSATSRIGLELLLQPAVSDDEIKKAFELFAKEHVDAVSPAADPLYNSKRQKIVALAATYALPAIYQWREFVDAGGLISMGPKITNAYYQTGVYVGRILKGESPADLPVMHPTTFELVINLKTAKALGLTVPPELLAIADDIIK